MRTVFSIFRNEEYLLPFWIKHHRALFDHGVMINHHSTDNSCDIVRTLAPDWELISSQNQEWDTLDEDLEFMTHEARFEGWKITLNTTEFLCAQSLDAVEARVLEGDLQGVHGRGVRMVDPLRPELPPLDASKALVRQRCWGFYEDEVSWGGLLRRHGVNLIKPRYASTRRSRLRIRPFFVKRTVPTSRGRLYHRARHGAYFSGRHETQLGKFCAAPENDMLVLHYYFSPWNEDMQRRATNRAEIFSARHEKLVPSSNHLRYMRDPSALEKERIPLAKKTRDLSLDPVFQRNTAIFV